MKPLHFREEVKFQKPQKWSKKKLNWVKRAVLPTDYVDVFFKKRIHEYRKKSDSKLNKKMERIYLCIFLTFEFFFLFFQ